MSGLGSLRPEGVWRFFEDICKIPRISKHEEKIRKYLLDFADVNNLQAIEDRAGNILIVKPASEGLERKKTVVLQSHMDMVGEKIAGHPHNWDTDPVIPYVTDGWVHAKGTTLGADDGIGIAAQLALLSDKNIRTGKLECLFTVDEESGMTGAINLSPDFFTGRILINLDSEDEGILYIGCAGGIETTAILSYKTEPVPEKSTAYEITLKGLRGGHSGDEIHKGYGNSVKIMAGLLDHLTGKYGIRIHRFEGGNIRNAIPREATTVITSSLLYSGHIKDEVNLYLKEIREKYKETEPGVELIANHVDLPANVIDQESQVNLIRSLLECPNGVIKWSEDMEDLVETSTNLAAVKFSGNRKIKIITSQRSSVDSEKNEIAKAVREVFAKAGAETLSSDGYPGWKPDINSEILDITRRSYHRLFGIEPQVRAIHAGLECGLIYEKYRDIDLISIGPTIRGAHTPDERLDIESVDRFWKLLIDVLSNIPEE